jgi:uncharacterized protein (DUF885 family)
MSVMPKTPRELADDYLDAVIAHDPMLATSLGLPDGADRLSDFSPAGLDAEADLARSALAALDTLTAPDDAERRCARLLRERLSASLALHEAGEHLRNVGTLFSPVQQVRGIFLQMPSVTEEDWSVIGARLGRVAEALEGYRAGLSEGMRRQLVAGPGQVEAVMAQLRSWGVDGGWFTAFAGRGPQADRGLLAGAASADAAVAALVDWMAAEYAPAAQAGDDAVGAERYRLHARFWTGSDLDLEEAYAWGWAEYARLGEQMHGAAEQVRPGASPREAMTYLDQHGPAIEGVDAVRAHLQALMDGAIEALQGVHFDLAEPLRRVEAMIAPAGSAAAPYYTPPSMDFSRPGRTWLPTLGRDRFPTWDLVSTWYHEGVPGHHLQLAQWVLVAPQLTRYQSTIGSVSANLEGWALYAERLMDELGFLTEPGERLGYLDAQQMRAVRVIIDIGMHLRLEIPREQGGGVPFRPGERWTPALAREFFGLNSGRPGDFLDSEIIRYLGMPGQAIGYKLGERAWLAGRAAARAVHEGRGEVFDAKAWHMAALSQGSLGLDDLTDELARL